MEATPHPTARELRAKARLQLHNAHQKLAEARHHLAICETLASGCTEPGIVNHATIHRFRLREYGLTERILRHYVRFNSTKAQ